MTTHKEMAALKSRHFLLSLHLILPLLLLAAGTLLFRYSDLDLKIQTRYYLGAGEWAFNGQTWALLIYRYGNIPALLTSIAGLLVFIFSYSKARLLPYRKLGLYLVLAMVIGPGLIANSILKDNWGRPRPREILQFGGEYRYEEPLSIDPLSNGKSFPCGHATMGFYFFALGFVLLSKRRILAWLIVLFALVWGGIIGWIRIGMGGHFASDVLWAGGIVYLVSFSLFRLMKLHRNPYYQSTGENAVKKLKTHHKILLALAGILIVIGVMLATPYTAKRTFLIEGQTGNSDSLKIELKLQLADLTLSLSPETKLSYRNNGFGFPGSKLKTRHEYLPARFSFEQRQKGFFTELSSKAELDIEPAKLAELRIELVEGKLSLPDGLLDTLYVEPNTTIAVKPQKTTILSATSPQGRYWIKSPKLSFR